MPVENPNERLPASTRLDIPRHDQGWVGVVGQSSVLNGAYAKLKRIAGIKKDQGEKLAGRSLEELPREQWLCRVEKHVTFMAPFEMEQLKRHTLAKRNRKFYGHFQPTPQVEGANDSRDSRDEDGYRRDCRRVN
jgi:hypothetical protein